MKCPHCGQDRPEFGFGLSKTQLKDLYARTIGPKGVDERVKAALTGVQLFSVEMEKLARENGWTPPTNQEHS
jgi:hypothetical protein